MWPGRGGPPEGLDAGRVRQHLPWAAAAVLATAAVTALAAAAHQVTEGRIDIVELFSDPAEVENYPWFIGAVSDVNLAIWAVAAALYALVAWGLRRSDPALAAGCASLGALTLIFLLDDRFLLHEVVYPWLFGWPEIVPFVIYGVVLLGILVGFRRTFLRQPELLLLLLGMFGLGCSVFLDVFGWDSDLRRVAEEAAKFLGTTAWALFPALILLRRLRAADTSR